jgi:hypothetical protein
MYIVFAKKIVNYENFDFHEKFFSVYLDLGSKGIRPALLQEQLDTYMNVGIVTVAAQCLSWEYLFRIFGIVSLQCGVHGRRNYINTNP